MTTEPKGQRRRNAPVKVEAYDPDDPQHVDQVAKGAHGEQH
jgi:hypothetical protein